MKPFEGHHSPCEDIALVIMYKLLSLFALLAVAFAAPVADPEAKPGVAFYSPGLPALAPPVYHQPLALYPGPQLTYSAPVAAYPAGYAPIGYNKVYNI